mgnify:CR=1 FL=1
MRIRLAAVAALLFTSLFAALPAATARAEDAPLLVFAAASMKNALDAADALYQKQSGRPVKISYAASSALAKQIEAGAPADLFISADLDWMNYLAQHKLIRSDSRSDLLANKIVLIAPASSTLEVEIAPHFPLAKLLGDGRLAIADPNAVPAGKYGKAALQSLGVWSEIEGKLAPAENVRAALRFVSRGETPLGIVYRTDAAADRGVRIVGSFPDGSHPPIIYPVAITTQSKNPSAAAYLAFLKSPAAAPAFERQGFTRLK